MTEARKPKHPRKGERYRMVVDPDTGQQRRVVLGINHNRTGYITYKCRCRKCTAAQRSYIAGYRAGKALQEV